MAVSQKKRGEKNRVLDPLLARALERLGRHIADEGITQSALADGAGMTQGHVSRILAGRSPEASFYLVCRMARAAGVSIDWLIAAAPAPASITPAPPSAVVESKTG